MAEDAAGMTGVDAATLAPMVRNLLDEPAATIAAGWSSRPLDGGASEEIGLYWVSESARRPVVEDRFGRPLEVVVAAWAELGPLQLEFAEEARELLTTMS